jgi:hypothetical protein
MKARLVQKSHDEFAGDILVETVVWELPEATKERPHRIKYRLYCGRGGRCLVRYDNETGKGDHRHYETGEEPYLFTSLAKLVDDFLTDVERLTGVRV